KHKKEDRIKQKKKKERLRNKKERKENKWRKSKSKGVFKQNIICSFAPIRNYKRLNCYEE
ncbi:MAG: hypothetical protein ACRDD0_10455, partial [Bacteroidales bacterium]